MSRTCVIVVAVLSVVIIAAVSFAVVRENNYRSEHTERELRDALLLEQTTHVIDSLTNVNVVLKNEAIEATAAGIEAVGNANYNQYLNDRKGIPTASDDSLKKLVLWQRPKQR